MVKKDIGEIMNSKCVNSNNEFFIKNNCEK